MPFNQQAERTAQEICQFAIGHRKIVDNPDDYALFEVVRGGQLVRRVQPNEKIRTMVVGRWLQWDAQDCYLVFKKDPMPPNNNVSHNLKLYST